MSRSGRLDSGKSSALAFWGVPRVLGMSPRLGDESSGAKRHKEDSRIKY